MLARSATSWSVRPRSVRSSRRRRRTRWSTGSTVVLLATLAIKLGRSRRIRHSRCMDQSWDVIIVGAGAAGLSAALVLGRARRSTLVIDAGGQSNRAAHGIGGLIGQDGRPPGDFYSAGRAELAAYPAVEMRSGEVRGG